MEPEYEIQTMKKDIDRLAKKTAINEPPGAPLPSEPMVSAQVELPQRPELIEETPRTKKVFIPIIVVIAVLLVGAGFYYWWNYVRLPEPARFLEVDEFEIIESLDISIPADISPALGDKYTFFVYKQENSAGLVAEITKREILETGLRDWENTMPEDLRPIFLGQEPGESVAEEFQNAVYKGVNIHYLNFTNSALAIDYALVGDYFVITTSKESMYQIIDRILTLTTP